MNPPIAVARHFSLSWRSLVLIACALIVTLAATAATSAVAAPDPRPSTKLRIANISFSPDGARILGTIYAGDQEYMQLWDTATGKPVGGPIRDISNKALYACWNHDGTRFAVFSGDPKVAQVQLWDAKTGTTVGKPMQTENEAGFPFFSDASGFLATLVRGKLSKWDPVTGRLLAQTRDKNHIAKLLALAYPRDQGFSAVPQNPITVAPGVTRTLSQAKDKAPIDLYDGTTGKKIASFGPVIESYRVFPQNKRLLLAVIRSNTYQMWDLRTGKRVGNPIETSGSLTLSPDGARLVEEELPQEKRCCVLWSVAETRPLARLPADRIRSGDYLFSPSGKSIATVKDADLMLWSVATGKKLFSARAAASTATAAK